MRDKSTMPVGDLKNRKKPESSAFGNDALTLWTSFAKGNECQIKTWVERIRLRIWMTR